MSLISMRGDHIWVHAGHLLVWGTALKPPVCWSSSENISGIPEASTGIRAKTGIFNLLFAEFYGTFVFGKHVSRILLTNLTPLPAQRGVSILGLSNLNKKLGMNNLLGSLQLRKVWGPWCSGIVLSEFPVWILYAIELPSKRCLVSSKLGHACHTHMKVTLQQGFQNDTKTYIKIIYIILDNI